MYHLAAVSALPEERDNNVPISDIGLVAGAGDKDAAKHAAAFVWRQLPLAFGKRAKEFCAGASGDLAVAFHGGIILA